MFWYAIGGQPQKGHFNPEDPLDPHSVRVARLRLIRKMNKKARELGVPVEGFTGLRHDVTVYPPLRQVQALAA